MKAYHNFHIFNSHNLLWLWWETSVWNILIKTYLKSKHYTRVKIFAILMVSWTLNVMILEKPGVCWWTSCQTVSTLLNGDQCWGFTVFAKMVNTYLLRCVSASWCPKIIHNNHENVLWLVKYRYLITFLGDLLCLIFIFAPNPECRICENVHIQNLQQVFPTLPYIYTHVTWCLVHYSAPSPDWRPATLVYDPFDLSFVQALYLQPLNNSSGFTGQMP